jgi:hypothetical protein
MITVDSQVPSRQAFGAGFEQTSRDPQLRDALMDGSLKLTPHPSWKMPPKLSWREDPFGQRNWRFQLHNLRWLDVLRRSALNGDDRAQTEWLRRVQSWIESNPPSRSYDEFAWTDMGDALRSLEFVFGYDITPEEDRPWLIDTIHHHGEWLSEEQHLGHSNHALHQHQALFVVSRFLREETWQKLAVDRLKSLFDECYDDQGINDEGAIGYHLLNYGWWKAAFRRLELEKVTLPANADRLDAAATALAHATRPDGTLERIGDTDDIRPTAIATPELDYVNSNGSKGTPPRALTSVYKRGYVFGRSGWGEYGRDFSDETYYSIVFGSANRMHGHADGAAVTFYSHGVPWLVDAGKYGYQPGDTMRQFVLDRAAHNVVTITDRPYKKDSVVTMVRHSCNPEIDDFVMSDEGYEGTQLERRVVYCRAGGFMFIIDVVRAESEVTAEQLWHLHPSVEAAPARRGFSLYGGSAKGQVRWLGTCPSLEVVKGSIEPFQGWVSVGWCKKQESAVLVARRNGERFRFLTLLGSGGSDDLSLESAYLQGAMRICVRSRGVDFNLDIQHDGVELRYSSDKD